MQVCYDSDVMRTRLFFVLCAGLALLAPSCQQLDGPLPAGCLKATDPEADALLQTARGHLASGKYKKAESVLNKLITRHPYAPCIPEAHFARAEAYAGKKDYRSAFKEYGKLVEGQQGSPLYAQALNRQLDMATSAAEGRLQVDMLGGMWKSKMDSSVVKEWLTNIIQNAPYNDMSAKAMFVLGNYLIELEEPEAACVIFAKLVERHPDSAYAPGAQLKAADLWAASRTRGNNNNLVNLHKALEAYEEFTLRFPHHKDIGRARAEIAKVKSSLVQQQLDLGRYYLERTNEYRSAVFCFEDVIRQKGVNPKAGAEAERLLPVARAKMNSPR